MGVLSGSRGGGSDLKIDHIPYGISLFDAGPKREYTTAYDLTPFHWLSGPEILFNNTRFAATRWLTTPYPKCLVLLPYPTIKEIFVLGIISFSGHSLIHSHGIHQHTDLFLIFALCPCATPSPSDWIEWGHREYRRILLVICTLTRPGPRLETRSSDLYLTRK